MGRRQSHHQVLGAQAVDPLFHLPSSQVPRDSPQHREQRAVAMEMMYRHALITQAAIGKAMGGLDYTTVSRERKRLREKVPANKVLGKALSDIENILLHK